MSSHRILFSCSGGGAEAKIWERLRNLSVSRSVPPAWSQIIKHGPSGSRSSVTTPMKKPIPSSEVVQSVRGDGSEWKVHAGAEVDYDEPDWCVVLGLESFLTKASTSGDREIASCRCCLARDRIGAFPRSQPAGGRCFCEFGSQSRHSIPP